MKTNNKNVFYCIVFYAIVSPCLIFAVEPTNLSVAKQAVVTYYESGEYAKDVHQVTIQAQNHLLKRVRENKENSKKMAVIFDIDDTLISNYPQIKKIDFAQTKKDVNEMIAGSNVLAIEDMLQLFNLVKDNKITIILITGRSDALRTHTIDELNKVGYKGWDQLYLRTERYQGLTPASYKTAIRKSLTESGYDIIFNIGDQSSDLTGGYVDKTYKLPNPMYFVK